MIDSLEIVNAESTLGATVTGVSLSALAPGEWSRIHAAFLEHAVLIFPGQHLSDDEQTAFGRRFGPLDVEAIHFTNEQPDGTLRPADDPLMQLLRGNEGWHSDNSYLPVSAGPSVLSARTVPSNGGETQWADMRAAYDALPPEMRERVRGLKAYHSLIESQARKGQSASGTKQAFAAITAAVSGKPSRASGAAAMHDSPRLRPLVKQHPETGRSSLFIGRHAYEILGLEPSESDALLEELNDFACQAPRILTHAWEVGDAVLWDNRCVLHRVRPFDPAEARRVVHTRVSGSSVTEAEESAPTA